MHGQSTPKEMMTDKRLGLKLGMKLDVRTIRAQI
jgi:hypothetical protein